MLILGDCIKWSGLDAGFEDRFSVRFAHFKKRALRALDFFLTLFLPLPIYTFG